MSVVIQPVSRRRDLRRFLHLPFRLHRDHQGWVPPLLADERYMLDPRRNGAFRYCDCALWLARDAGGEVVGRIAGIINRRYNEIKGEHQARFTHLDCVDDVEVMDALLGQVKQWAHEAGMEVVIGPMGFTDQDPEGFVIEGFDEEPSIATYHNREYIVRLLERLGWGKDVDYVVYKVPVPKEIPPFYERVYQHVARHNTFRLLEQLYIHVPPDGPGDVIGVLVALAFRMVTIVIAAVGVVFYWTSRREVRDVIKRAEQVNDATSA